MLMNFQHRSTVTLTRLVQNRGSFMKNSDARPFWVRDHAALSATSVRISKNWTTTSAHLRARNTKSVKYCRALTTTTQNVSKRVSAQGWFAFLFESLWVVSLRCQIIQIYRQDNEPAKFACSNSDCGVSSFKVPGCINLYGDLNECCSTSIVCGK